MKTAYQTTQFLEGNLRRVTIPAGLRVKPATNLPSESPIKYWLDELPEELAQDREVESHFRNIGFGYSESEVVG